MSILITTGIGNNNPDSYSMYSTLYTNKDYETEVAGDIDGPNGGVCTSAWQPTGGYNNSGVWKHTLSTGSEGQAGVIGRYSPITLDECEVLVVSYMLYISPDLMTDIIAPPAGGFWGMKSLDVTQWNQAGSTRENRQTMQPDEFDPGDGLGLYNSHVEGGAGIRYFDDGGGNLFNIADHPGEWIWQCHVFDGPNKTTRSYHKVAGNSGVTRNLSRTQGDLPGDPYSYTEPFRGWYDVSTIYGYWQNMSGGSPTAEKYLMVDRVRIGDGWIDPPF